MGNLMFVSVYETRRRTTGSYKIVDLAKLASKIVINQLEEVYIIATFYFCILQPLFDTNCKNYFPRQQRLPPQIGQSSGVPTHPLSVLCRLLQRSYAPQVPPKHRCISLLPRFFARCCPRKKKTRQKRLCPTPPKLINAQSTIHRPAPNSAPSSCSVPLPGADWLEDLPVFCFWGAVSAPC